MLGTIIRLASINLLLMVFVELISLIRRSTSRMRSSTILKSTRDSTKWTSISLKEVTRIVTNTQTDFLRPSLRSCHHIVHASVMTLGSIRAVLYALKIFKPMCSLFGCIIFQALERKIMGSWRREMW